MHRSEPLACSTTRSLRNQAQLTSATLTSLGAPKRRDASVGFLAGAVAACPTHCWDSCLLFKYDKATIDKREPQESFVFFQRKYEIAWGVKIRSHRHRNVQNKGLCFNDEHFLKSWRALGRSGSGLKNCR